jgi:hypothetical protein
LITPYGGFRKGLQAIIKERVAHLGAER